MDMKEKEEQLIQVCKMLEDCLHVRAKLVSSYVNGLTYCIEIKSTFNFTCKYDIVPYLLCNYTTAHIYTDIRDRYVKDFEDEFLFKVRGKVTR